MVVKVVIQKENRALIEAASIEHIKKDSLTGLNTYKIRSVCGEIYKAVSRFDLITRAAFGNELECTELTHNFSSTEG